MSTSRSGTSKKKKTGKRTHPKDTNILHPEALGFGLGDGNADKVAEKLKPSPNFYVHDCLFFRTNNNIFPSWSKTRAISRSLQITNPSLFNQDSTINKRRNIQLAAIPRSEINKLEREETLHDTLTRQTSLSADEFSHNSSM